MASKGPSSQGFVCFSASFAHPPCLALPSTSICENADVRSRSGRPKQRPRASSQKKGCFKLGVVLPQLPGEILRAIFSQF